MHNKLLTRHDFRPCYNSPSETTERLRNPCNLSGSRNKFPKAERPQSILALSGKNDNVALRLTEFFPRIIFTLIPSTANKHVKLFGISYHPEHLPRDRTRYPSKLILVSCVPRLQFPSRILSGNPELEAFLSHLPKESNVTHRNPGPSKEISSNDHYL